MNAVHLRRIDPARAPLLLARRGARSFRRGLAGQGVWTHRRAWVHGGRALLHSFTDREVGLIFIAGIDYEAQLSAVHCSASRTHKEWTRPDAEHDCGGA
jgi:hypothetical protein